MVFAFKCDTLQVFLCVVGVVKYARPSVAAFGVIVVLAVCSTKVPHQLK